MHIMLYNLKSLRTQSGYTQVRLAQESGVSLPTIQNIEARKGNPTIDILEKILMALGLKLSISNPAFDFERAIELGVPLSGESKINLKKTNKVLLAKESKKWVYLFINNQLNKREEEALLAFLMAIMDHYPTYYSDFLACPIFDQKIKETRNDGRLLKLRRIALAQLSRYL